MAIPNYQSIMLPLLQALADGELHPLADLRERLGAHFSLTPDEREEMLPSGNQSVFDNRLGWARTYLKQAGLVDAVRRGVFRITDRGRALLENPPAQITAKFLERYPEFIEFRDRGKGRNKNEPAEAVTTETPDETIEAAYGQLREELVAELRSQLDSVSWRFFERLVIDVLVAMGYGGSRAEAGRAFQKGSDEGIDGTIKEDRLGLDIIYVQAKRWAKGSMVGRPEVQKFAGALQGKRARKGVFITTADFSDEARQYVQYIDSKIILINGQELAELMIDHNVGVSASATYVIKKLDTDYFEGA